MLLFRVLKKALAINSTKSTIDVASTVSTKSLMYFTEPVSVAGNCFSIHCQMGNSISTTSRPYTTKTRLMPTRVVTIKRAGRSAYMPHSFPLFVPCLRFSSIDNLLADIKAISIPAKKPISNREAIMAIKAIQSIV